MFPQPHRYSNTFIRTIQAAECLNGVATDPLPLLSQIRSHAHSCSQPMKVGGQWKKAFAGEGRGQENRVERGLWSRNIPETAED